MANLRISSKLLLIGSLIAVLALVAVAVAPDAVSSAQGSGLDWQTIV